MSITLNIDLTRLMSQPGRLEAIIRDMGRFLAAFLETRHTSLEVFHIPDLQSRHFRIVNGSTLSDLIVEGGPCDLRTIIQKEEIIFEIKLVLEFAKEYVASLTLLHKVTLLSETPSDVVEMSQFIGSVEENHGFLIRHSVHNLVKVGGFVLYLNDALKESVFAWLRKSDLVIASCYGLNGDSDRGWSECTAPLDIIYELCGMICNRISMSYKSPIKNLTGSEWENISVSSLEKLLRIVFFSEKVAHCVNEAAGVQRAQLEAIKLLCNADSDDDLRELFFTHSDVLKSAIHNPPEALRVVSGPHMKLFQFERLVSALKSTNEPALLSLHILQWRKDVATEALKLVVDNALSLLEAKQNSVVEPGFLPTLACMRWALPAPTWTSDRRAPSTSTTQSPSYECVKGSANDGDEDMFAGSSSSTTRASSSVLKLIQTTTERRLRLISLVWEIFAHPRLSDVYFTEGRVFSTIVQQTAVLEIERTSFSMQSLHDYKKHFSVGFDLSKARASIHDYRGGSLETDIRKAMCALSNWPLEEILAVSCHDTAIFEDCYFRLTDATRGAMWRPFQKEETGVVRQALRLANKIIYEIRTANSSNTLFVPTIVGDRLRVIPAIRNWDQRGDSLILSFTDVNEAGDELIAYVRELVKNRKLGLVIQRRIKTRTVFEFNGPYLRMTLDGPATAE